MARQALSSWMGIAAVISLCAGAFVSACAANGRTNSFDDGDGGGKSSGNSSDNGGVGGGVFTTSTGDPTVTVGAGGGSACAATSTKAEQIPLDMFIMQDQSGSMDTAAGSGTRWTAVSDALKTFVQQPGLDGVGVGIQYFGLPPGGGMACPQTCMSDADCGMCGPCTLFPFPGFPGVCAGAGGSDSCNAVDYSTPEVEIAPLPGVAAQIIASIDKHSPTTGTPTHPALGGAIMHAVDWYSTHPDHAVIVVLATDGQPEACNTNLNDINQLAADGLAKGIITFVIGVGDQLSNLNGIAAAGGSQQAFFVDSNANANQEFLDAMNSIRGSALACSYKIPVPTMGVPDYNAVNVQYTPGDGSKPQVFPKVANKQACPVDGSDAWFYDNNNAPTQIVMCDATCQKIKADDKGQVDILLGCETIVN